MHVPGMKVVAPSTPYDTKGCLIQSIRDDNPVVFVEHRLIHYQRGHVPESDYTVPFGQARVLAEGSDITLVGISHMAVECLGAKRYLDDMGLRAEVIDPVSLSPLDIDTIAASVEKTGKLLVVDTSWTTCGASAEIIVQVTEHLGSAKKECRRMGFAPVTCPTTKNLENHFYPDSQKIATAAYRMVHGNNASPIFNQKANISMPNVASPESVEFRGPF